MKQVPTTESYTRHGFTFEGSHHYMDVDCTVPVKFELRMGTGTYNVSEPHEVTITTKHQRQQRKRKRK